ncbi:hypothetical protein MIND_00725400 [Mycena indigotica]|uniref:Carboxymethylenebutenolidase n=1 Tax=Mycena indigotica TaxID=2126181 RepID=A0A8H6W6Z2_9AGAR|nr:uncharacterized protein MIND_00725400 [Mycena indigotica]KAF7301599.1 hypothetical protein MIND_00725400 [Mycena indigotica]
MAPPEVYDPNSPAEQPVALPSAPPAFLSGTITLQPPLTRRGTGPGLIMFLPPEGRLNSTSNLERMSLDPRPLQKWAEEGFCVAGIISNGQEKLEDDFETATNSLLQLKELDTADKFAVVVYDLEVLPQVLSAIKSDNRIVSLVIYGHQQPSQVVSTIPTIIFVPSTTENLTATTPDITIFKVDAQHPSFALPQSVVFHSSAASIAHSKASVHIKKYLGGPFFDLEAIWEEHTYFEFEVRSVALTMGTMVAEPYVNHVPTLAGGIGRKQLSAFYRDHFIFNNPKDTRLQSISRTVGSDRVVDEFIFHCTHDKQIDWLLPGVPPTGRKLAIPMLGVINIRGDRLYHEHIWWDQGTACMQAGILPSHVEFDGKRLRLPIAGVESAKLLEDESAVAPNEMLGPSYGFE